LNSELHIVSFDVPYPPNYGGVVDVYFKIKALHQLGVKIHLHCFEYGRGEQKELNALCQSVQYYRRDENKLNFLKKQPYVVASRSSRELLEVLKSDSHPILIEGLHNCWLIEELKDDDRFIMVRTHNVEHDYYEGLAKVEKNIAKRQYFKWEASKLAKFENVLKYASRLLTISPNDQAYFNSKYSNAKLLPAFHSSESVSIKSGKGNFALYHGNMAVNENIEGATFLIEQVFKETDYNLIIAGSNIPNELIQLTKGMRNVELRSNVSLQKLDSLLQSAQVNVLPTFQPTGIKLKLLSALYKGRFCIVNNEMISNTGLEETCILANSPAEWKIKLAEVFDKTFENKDISDRTKLLENLFDNLENAKLISELMTQHSLTEK
jgi:hypothetical protein